MCFHLVSSGCDGARAPVGVNDLMVNDHTGPHRAIISRGQSFPSEGSQVGAGGPIAES